MVGRVVCIYAAMDAIDQPSLWSRITASLRSAGSGIWCQGWLRPHLVSCFFPCSGLRNHNETYVGCIVSCTTATRCSRGSCMPRNLRAISTDMDISGSKTGGSLGKMAWPESRFRCGSTKVRSKLSTRRWPSRCMNSEYGVSASRPENGTRRFGALALSRMSSLFEEHGVSRGPTYLTGSRL